MRSCDFGSQDRAKSIAEPTRAESTVSANGSISAGHFKVSEIPRTGGSMVGLLEDVIKVGQVMGFKMEGVIANLEELIGTQGGKEGYR
ncbi:hypothetical protein Tco_1017240 [Tanacetum coccineum]|uniref:Uncharacterized protein n=1 Tax=Tanacetum coccineum TaxID=301880 RepID=A0ABQ5FS57_9ASTR